MAFQIENGVCAGRGFDSNGFCGKLKTWAVKTPANGGPGWYMVDDQSSASNPYIVIADTSSQTVNGVYKFVKIGYLASEAGYVRAQYMLWWNSATHIGYGYYGGWRIMTYDAAEFVYDFRGGSEILAITSRLGTSYYYTFIDEWNGDVNFVEDVTKTTTLTDKLVSYSDATASSYSEMPGSYSNYTMARVDVGNLYKLYGQTTSSNGKSKFLTDLTPGDWVFCNGTGMTSRCRRVVSIESDSELTVDVPFPISCTESRTYKVTGFSEIYNPVAPVASGEEGLFTLDNYYFLYDLNEHTWFSYSKVTNIDTVNHYLTFDKVKFPFPSGTKITSYAHRFIAGSNSWENVSLENIQILNYRTSIPYISSYGSEIAQPGAYAYLYASARCSYDTYISAPKMSPDDKGKYVCQRPGVYESTDGVGQSTNANRGYGSLKNTYVTNIGSMLFRTDGRTINGKNFLYWGSASYVLSTANDLAVLIPDEESV